MLVNPRDLLAFFPNSWEFLVQILQAYCIFSSTLDFKFLFNYLQLWRSYAILSATVRPPSVPFGRWPMVDILSMLYELGGRA